MPSPDARSSAYWGLMRSLMIRSRSSKEEKADFMALTVSHSKPSHV